MENNPDRGLVYFLLFAGASAMFGVIVQIIYDILTS